MKKAISHWWNYASHWQNLRHFFSLSVVKFFVTWFAVAPVVVKILERAPREIVIRWNSTELMLVLELPFSWVILWFSSFLFTLALLIYYAQCPDFVKRSPSFAAFKEEQHSPRWLCWLLYYSWEGTGQHDKLAKRLIDKSFATTVSAFDSKYVSPQVEQRGTIWQFQYNEIAYEVCIDENLPPNREKDLFWEIFGRWSSSKPIWRHLIWVLTTIAILLVLWVVGENVLYVLRFLLGR